MIDGLLSLEVRWFLSGELPEEVRQWFNYDCPGDLLGSPEEREDLYLYVPQCEYLNFKLRQGSLEVKWRKAQLDNQQLASFEGKIEKWQKWTCEDSAQDLVSTATGKAWVRVKKVRSQRSYEDVTCELTQLTVNNNAWWSLAFEAVSDPLTQTDNFASAIAKVGQTYQGPQLSVQQSFAYPHWLSFQS